MKKTEAMKGATIYASPLTGRYCSKDAKVIAGESYRWWCIRQIWLAVLQSQMELGVLTNPPSQKAVELFREKLMEFDWDKIREIERETKHDVMANISYITDHLVPELGQVIHLGMTSEDATSNGEILQQNAMLEHVIAHTAHFVTTALEQVMNYKSLPMLGETHLQPATAVTLGKRIAMWVGPVMEDLFAMQELLNNRCIKGVRGATGTYEALLKLMDGDVSMVEVFQFKVAEKLETEVTWMVPGQTAPRSWDIELVHRFVSLGTNLAKFATDFRHLARTGEFGEPRGKNQVGSSAMPWKQNPMKAERLNALARELPGKYLSAVMTQQTQGLERTLDDSAGRRMYISESFLIADACLRLANELMEGLNVFENVVHSRLAKMLPFLATEEILSVAVKAGKPRQDTHHYIMQLCKEVWADLSNGVIAENNLLSRIQEDPDSPLVGLDIPTNLDPEKYIGLSVALCDELVHSEQATAAKLITEKYSVTVEKSEV